MNVGVVSRPRCSPVGEVSRPRCSPVGEVSGPRFPRFRISPVIMILNLLLFILLNSLPVTPEEVQNRQVILHYSAKKENRINCSFPIKTGIAEYFKSKTGKDLLYLVFYPYRIPPEKWRSVYEYRKTDPENFAVIKMEIHGQSPIKPGSFPIMAGSSIGEAESGNFTPTLITTNFSFRGTTGTGVLTITEMDLKKGSFISGNIYYKDSDFELSGPFRAKFILDH